ncbi:hypothetical protein ALC57_02548 [Trachymyrmex cornetzi]|uniref:Uncharacterized protein n=1 Tax=Trachymyrmex cornetzi TaxID=471704 RepID=A0A151JP15_9HYME|nr:hypothetical protein ALC57_02548 [Trachymyrmex cornetzi]
MFPVVSDNLHSLTSKELEYIPKIVLLRQFINYNLPTHQTHIDGPTPLIKNCSECR